MFSRSIFKLATTKTNRVSTLNFNRQSTTLDRNNKSSLQTRNFVTNISKEQVEETIRNRQEKKPVPIVDVREPHEIVITGRIGESINVPLGEFENAFKLSEQQFEQQYGSPKPNQNERLILHCRTGARSAKAGVIAEKLGYKNVENYVGSALEWFDVNAKRYEGASSTIHDYFKFEEQQKRQEKRARSGGLDGDMSLTDNSAASATSTSTATTTTKQTAISDIQEPNIEWDSDPKLKQVFDEFQLQKQHQQKRDTPSPIFLEIYNRTKQLIQQKHGGSSLTAVSKNEVKRALEKAHDEIYAQVKQETAASQHKLNAHVDQLAKQKYPNRSVQSLSASEIAPLRAQAVKELEKQEFSK